MDCEASQCVGCTEFCGNNFFGCGENLCVVGESFCAVGLICVLWNESA